MKKIFTIIMIYGVIGFLGFTAMYIQRQNDVINELKSSVQDKESEIDGLNNTIDRLNDENHGLQDEIENVSNEVYKMQNGEAYNISVHHGDEKHTWSWDGKLFGRKSHTVIK